MWTNLYSPNRIGSKVVGTLQIRNIFTCTWHPRIYPIEPERELEHVGIVYCRMDEI